MMSVGTHHNSPGQGTLIRQPATAQLLIDSLDRFPRGYPDTVAQAAAQSSSNWQLNLNQIVMNGYITRLGVSQILFQWNLPTIIAGYNDTFRINRDGTVNTITLLQGWYNVTAMAVEIETALNTSYGPASFTVTWDAVNGVFQLDSGAGHTCFIVAPTGSPTEVIERRTCHTLGFLGAASGVQNYRGITPTMFPTRYIDICSTYLTKYQRLKDANTLLSNITSTCIARLFGVPLNSSEKYLGETALRDSSSPGDAPFVITVDYTFPKQIAWNPEEGLSNFDLQLRDEDGELVPYVVPAAGEAGIMCEYTIVLLASED